MEFVDTLLLLALPASGKSEVRRFLMHLDRQKRVEQYHLNDTVQLDDYPYVEFFRDVDDACVAIGHRRLFFKADDGGFIHGEDWGTLLQLVNDDYEVMIDPAKPSPTSDPRPLFARIDKGRKAVGAPAVFEDLPKDVVEQLAERMEKKCAWVVKELFGNRPKTLEGKTIVIEFARGGPQGSGMPLKAPHGYQWSLSHLHPEILAKAGVLYVWVEPEESRRKNAARAVPNAENTIIFHAAPEAVMINDYGCDDMDHLIKTSSVPNTITIEAKGKKYLLPVARFDNRVDKTTFVRDEPSEWDPKLVDELGHGLNDAVTRMWTAYKEVHKV